MTMFLAVLAVAAQAAGPAPPLYRAQGSNPPWTLTIADGKLTYESPGQAPVSIVAPRSTSEQGMVRYAGQGLEIVILPMPCTDKASGRRFVDTVIVEAGRDERGGCGGAELAADSLNGTSWHFAEIGGESTGLTGDLLQDDRYAIDFGPDSFVGYDGCNRFSAHYSQADGVLTLKPPFGSTDGRCDEAVMRRRARLIDILGSPVRVSFPDPKTMMLTGDKGTIKMLRTEED
jgi:heat shock protein HslJ